MTAGASVLVAMSGGVDSSMAALLLKQQGYAVTGVTFRLWQLGAESSAKSIARAQAVCEKLAIRHIVVDLQQQFEQTIVQSFVQAYLQGQTPNPCVNCNRRIKWAQLRALANEAKIDWIATGHYARIIKDDTTGRYQLMKARDATKDQSYALWRLTQNDLARTLFPLGNLTKTEVKKVAAEVGLVPETLKESQDICFIPENDYRQFLLEYAGDRIRAIGEGELVTEEGAIVGKHAGFYNFTIGQRKGFKRGFKERMYVKRLDPVQNQVVISNREGLAAHGLIIREVNFVSQPESSEFAGEVKIRYGSPGVAARGRQIDNDRYELLFSTPQFAVCPGQSAVVYAGEQLLLGGVIETPLE